MANLPGRLYRDGWCIRVADVFHHLPAAIVLPGIDGDVLTLLAKDLFRIRGAHRHRVRSTGVANLARLRDFHPVGAELHGEMWISR